MAQVIALTPRKTCTRCGEVRVCTLWAGEWDCLPCLGTAIYTGQPVAEAERLDQMDIPYPVCAAAGSTPCPIACHGFGRCAECGDTGRVRCSLCHGSGQVPLGCAHLYPAPAVEAAARAHLAGTRPRSLLGLL
jgi:hypothetical protein